MSASNKITSLLSLFTFFCKMRSWLIYELIKVNVGFVIFITNFQAEKFGDSFVLEGKISEEIKKDIHQAVSGCFI